MSVMRKSDFIGLALLGFVIGCRYSAPVADFYAQKCYPVLSTVLSRVVSACPVSLEEVVVVGFIAPLFAAARAVPNICLPESFA